MPTVYEGELEEDGTFSLLKHATFDVNKNKLTGDQSEGIILKKEKITPLLEMEDHKLLVATRESILLMADLEVIRVYEN